MPSIRDHCAEPTVQVWDPFVRLFHWSLAASFLGAYVLGEDGGDAHRLLGYAAASLVAVRIVWGFVGTRHARFADFVPGPARLSGYLGDLLRGRGRRYLGHNPAGAVMILFLLVSVPVLALTGWLMETDRFFGVRWIQDLHEALAAVTLTGVGLHVAGVVLESLRHRENLPLAMITGRKRSGNR